MTVKQFLTIVQSSRSMAEFINRINAAQAPYHTGSWDSR